MKKLLFIFFILSLLFSFNYVLAQEQIEIDFFYSQTCPHCAQEKIFLEDLKSDYPEIKVNSFDFSKNIDLLKQYYQEYDVSEEFHGLVPITFVQDKHFVGFEEETGNEIRDLIEGKGSGTDDINKNIKVPFIGEINPDDFSLFSLAVVLGFLDGFNVCSLGALILILSLVLALKSRARVLIFGGIFIITTAVVYGLLIVLWYQVFSFFASYLRILEILIGILAIFGGIYFLKEFIRFRKMGATCEVGGGKKVMSKFSLKFERAIKESKNVFLILGIVLLFAAIITIVEFPCSAAVPVVFAGILANSQLSSLTYLFYISLFIIFYMIDEIIVFLIAFFTMKVWLTSNKSIIWITLIEAIILFALGFWYFFGILI
jgi:glutaredoxin-related protein/cytochrome c biogenesis protein CcdA